MRDKRKEVKNVMEFVAIISYMLVAACVVFLSIKLSDFVDLLDKKTNVSGAFLGGILLAAVTSLPELFTSITAVVLPPNHDNHLVLGNILGSDIFNVTLFFIVYAIFYKKIANSKVNKVHLFTMGIIGAMYVSVILASFIFDKNGWLLGWFNPLSILILAIYVFAVIKTPKEEESEDKTTDSKLTAKQIIILFIVFSILLVGASIGLTYIVEWVCDLFKMGATFGGALFLGVATSLPEMTATITLCRKRNYNAAIGDIVGSCSFNFIILTLADIFSFLVKDGAGNYVGTYRLDQSAFLLIVCGAFSMILSAICIGLHVKGKLATKKSARIANLVLSILLVGSYLTFLILSNIDLGLNFAPLA